MKQSDLEVAKENLHRAVRKMHHVLPIDAANALFEAHDKANDNYDYVSLGEAVGKFRLQWVRAEERMISAPEQVISDANVLMFQVEKFLKKKEDE